MKVLFIAGNMRQVGGIERYNRVFVEALRGAGGQVFVVERNPGGLVAKASFVIRVIGTAFVRRPAFIVCTHLHFAPLCHMLKKLLGIRYSVSVYGIEVADIKEVRAREALDAAELIVYLFPATADDVVRQVHGAEKKLFQLPNSVDGATFHVMPRSPALIARFGLESKKVILTIGRMSTKDGENKGYRRVIAAMPRVLARVPDARYLLAGGGDDVPQVKELVRTMGLEDHVVVTDPPRDEEIAEYYNLGDVFVLPSKREGFPAIVLLEALACGVPVIGGDQRGAEEALLNGALGLIVPSDDVTAIADAIVRVLRREASSELFDRDALRTQALAVYGREAYTARARQFVERIRI